MLAEVPKERQVYVPLERLAELVQHSLLEVEEIVVVLFLKEILLEVETEGRHTVHEQEQQHSLHDLQHLETLG